MGHPPRFGVFYQRCLAIGFFWQVHCGFPLTIVLCLPLCGIEIGIGNRED